MHRFSEADLILNKDGSVYHLNLKPENVAENIITVGDPGRVYRISQHFDEIEFEMNKREFITHTGTYKGKRITVLSTGMGVDNIEIAMIELDALFNIDLKLRIPKEDKRSFNIVRIGTSGAIQEDFQIDAEVISEYAIGMDNLMQYYSFEQSNFETEISQHLQDELDLPIIPYAVKCSEMLLAKIGVGMVNGNSVTTPGFYAPQGRQLRIATRNPKFIDQITYFNHNGFRLTNFEMETSAYYAFARLLGHHALSISTILANRTTGEFSKNESKTINAVISKVLDRI